MTNTTWSAAPNFASDAAFRTWGGQFNTALAAVGMVQSADTGQINWTTVTRASTNTDAGYEIWHFNDALQSTSPIFFKLYYGTAGTAGYPRLRLEVGTASNGSGTIAGTVYGTVVTVMTMAASDTTARDNWMASDGSGLVMALFNNSSNSTAKTVIAIDRFRDSTGTASGAGYSVEYNNLSSPRGNIIVNATDGKVAPASLGSFICCLVPFPVVSNTSFADASGNITTFPHYFATRQGSFASKMLLSYAVTDLAYDNQQAITHLGSSRTYRSLGANASYYEATGSLQYVSALIWWS